ncbi:hypothetical protein TNCV_4495991 [Trichonephila clavipes]|nr:hypothetical protein TNCV_4495991 [Trichonephila clavipes]
MVLKAKRATTGVHHRDHDEFRGSRSDIVRQVATTKQQQQADKCGRAEKKRGRMWAIPPTEAIKKNSGRNSNYGKWLEKSKNLI